ncbi:MAG: nicotinate-nucleotide--dimethylbenzimidazole phosphoribosyltransferase [Oscillospiraceae bacterium]
MTLEQLIAQIGPADAACAAAAWKRWDAVAKPLRALGVVHIAAMRRNVDVALSKRGVVVMCADNGVVCEGVTQCGSEVTAIVTENMARHDSSVCHMARVARAEVFPVDVGVDADLVADGIIRHKIARGTRNIACGPAMTREQATDAILFGASLVERLAAQGYDILCTGEMGIGNTTTSSAVAAVLLGRAPAQVTGRGAGLSSEGLVRKISAIERAIAVNRPDAADPLGVISTVGGLDLAALTGVFLGGAYSHLPIVIDGFISSVAALAAKRLCPASADYMLASHISGEPAGIMVLNEIGLKPVICAGMSLGEGTGAVTLLPLLDMAVSVYHDMSTFSEVSIAEYQPLT